jgi:hypothetical protein
VGFEIRGDDLIQFLTTVHVGGASSPNNPLQPTGFSVKHFANKNSNMLATEASG